MVTYKSNISRLRIIKEPAIFKKVKLTSSKDATDYVRQFYYDDIEVYESMFMIILNRANNTEAYVKISQGGTAGTVVDIKLVAKYAMDCLANGIILVHNHPSGNTQPSKADKTITKRVKSALKLCDISLLDHIIITKDNYFSFADNKIL